MNVDGWAGSGHNSHSEAHSLGCMNSNTVSFHFSWDRAAMAALVSCYALLLVVVSCTASQWSKPLATDNRRLSTASEDWVCG